MNFRQDMGMDYLANSKLDKGRFLLAELKSRSMGIKHSESVSNVDKMKSETVYKELEGFGWRWNGSDWKSG